LEEAEVVSVLEKTPNQPDDAEFIKNLNNSFKKERGILDIKPDAGTLTFAQISVRLY
jgi:hypothetical protein